MRLVVHGGPWYDKDLRTSKLLCFLLYCVCTYCLFKHLSSFFAGVEGCLYVCRTVSALVNISVYPHFYAGILCMYVLYICAHLLSFFAGIGVAFTFFALCLRLR